MAQISLLMTNYNSSKYIQDSIESILNQTAKEWELIIVDDASTDDSINIIEPYLKDKRIKIIPHTLNQGYAAALITAIDNSTANIIGIINSDDALHRDAVKIMIAAHTKYPDFGLIYSKYYECDSNLTIKRIVEWVGEIKEGKTNLHEAKTSHFTTFKKEDYDKTTGFDIKQKKAVDKDLIYKLEEVTKLKFINIPLYYYRHHKKGISQEYNKTALYYYVILAIFKAYKRRLNLDIHNLTRKEMALFYYATGIYFIRKSQPKKAQPFLLEAMIANPFNMRYRAIYLLKRFSSLVVKLSRPSTIQNTLIRRLVIRVFKR